MLCTDQDTWASFSLTKLVILLLSSCICKTGFQTKRGEWLDFAERHLFYLELESSKLLIVDRLDHWKLSVASKPWIRQFIKTCQHLSKAFLLQTNRSHLSSSFSWRAATSFRTRCSSLAPWIYLSCLCFATFQSFLLCFLFFFTTIFTSLFNCPIIICLKSSWRPSPFAACPLPAFPSYSANPSDSSSCPELQLSPNKSLLSPSTKKTSLVPPTSSW